MPNVQSIAPKVSIVIPLLNEAASLPELVAWIARAVSSSFDYELIFIDDGSTDESWQVIAELSLSHQEIIAFRFNRNYGKTAALELGFAKAKGTYIITMDADLQDSPDELVNLVSRMDAEQLDIISGWKKKRHDPIAKTWPSKLFNAVIRRVSKIQLHDFNCGLKIYRAEVAKALHLYGDMHRFLPVLAKWNGFTKIEEQIVTHHERQYGESKFGWSRLISGFLDLLSVTFVGRFKKHPMHFFGTLGVLTFMVGFGIAAYLIGNKLYVNLVLNAAADPITLKWQFYIAIASLIIGTQLFLAGFLAEMFALSRHRRGGHSYLLRDEILRSENSNASNSE